MIIPCFCVSFVAMKRLFSMIYQPSDKLNYLNIKERDRFS